MDEGTPSGELVLLETSDAARELKLSGKAIHGLVTSGQLPVFGRTRRGVRLFKFDAIEKLRRQRTGTSPHQSKRRACEAGRKGKLQ